MISAQRHQHRSHTPECSSRVSEHRVGRPGEPSIPACRKLRGMSQIPLTQLPDEPAVSCSNCAACCCQLEVMLITDTGVPQRFIDTDDWGGEVMRRLDDGWCAALDRDSMRCTIYELRPLICREFETGSPECVDERRGMDTIYR